MYTDSTHIGKLEFDNVDICDLLLNNGASSVTQDQNGKTAYDYAIRCKHENIARRIEEAADFVHHVQVGEQRKKPNPTRRTKVKKKCREKASKPVDERTNIEKFHSAAKTGKYKLLTRMLKAGVSPDIKDEIGNTALLNATRSGFKKCCEVLLTTKNKASPNIPDLKGQTPLHLSVVHGKQECCRILLKSDVNVDTLDNAGLAPLHIAAYKNKYFFCQNLLEKGANVNLKTGNGQTALHLAIKGGNLKIFELMLLSNADLQITTSDMRTVLHLAAFYNRDDLCQFFLENNVVVDQVPIHQSFFTVPLSKS